MAVLGYLGDYLGTDDGGGGGGGGADPVLSNPLPATMPVDRYVARYTPISFDIANSSTKFALIIKFRNDDRGYLLYDSRTGFAPPFNSTSSTWDNTAKRLTVLQEGGWQDEIVSINVGGQGDVNAMPIRPGGPGSDAPPNGA